MIDYDKLKKAHELAANLNLCAYLSTVYIPSCSQFRIELKLNNGDGVKDYFSIDAVINKLHEIGGPSHKYKIGQYVWVMGEYANDIECGEILDIDLPSEYVYLINQVWHYEKDIYPTKSALIESQIAFWNNLDIEENKNE